MESALFERACGRSVGLEMGAVDYDNGWLWTLRDKALEDTVEHTQGRPADKTVVKRHVRPLGFGGVVSLEAISDHVDDTAHPSPVINARCAVK